MCAHLPVNPKQLTWKRFHAFLHLLSDTLEEIPSLYFLVAQIYMGLKKGSKTNSWRKNSKLVANKHRYFS